MDAGLDAFDYSSEIDGFGLRLERVMDHTSGDLAGHDHVADFGQCGSPSRSAVECVRQ